MEPTRETLPDGSPLATDYRKALSCDERAWFYATTAKVGNKHNPPQSQTPPIVDPSLKYFNFITRTYIGAGKKLFTRLESTTLEYLRLYDDLVKNEIKVADRDEEAIRRSRAFIATRFKTLGNSALKREPTVSLEQQIQYHREDWQGLHEMCYLVMDEITYLSGRVDGFNNLLNAKIAQDVAKTGLKAAQDSVDAAGFGVNVAIVTLIITALLTVLFSSWSLCVAYKAIHDAHDDAIAALPKPDDETPVHAIHAEFDKLESEKGDLKTIESILNTVEDKLKNMDSTMSKISGDIQFPNRTDSDPKDLLTDLSGIQSSLETIKKSINQNAEAKDDLYTRIDTLIATMGRLELLVQGLPGSPQDIPVVSTNIKNLEGSVKELKDAIEKTKPSEVNKKTLINLGN